MVTRNLSLHCSSFIFLWSASFLGIGSPQKLIAIYNCRELGKITLQNFPIPITELGRFGDPNIWVLTKQNKLGP